MYRNNKRRSMLIGMIFVAIILITGTYAWQNFGQGAFNPMHYRNEIVGGRIHDDFQRNNLDPNDPTFGPGLFDKAVFGENFGHSDLQLRVRLSEFLRIDDNDPVGGAVITDPTTWPIFTIAGEFGPNNEFTRANHEGRPGAVAVGIDGNIQWALGSAALEGSAGTRGSKYYIPTHNRLTRPLTAQEAADLAAANPDRPYFGDELAYRFANTTGRGVDALATNNTEAPNLPGTAPLVTAPTAPEFYERGTVTGNNNPAVAPGTHNQFGPGDSFENVLMYVTPGTNSEVRTETVTHYAQSTLTPTFTGVMTYEQWIYANRPAGNFWILDIETGWFYWNGVLPAATPEQREAGQTVATSLLLNAINVNPNSRQEWEYIIHIDADWWLPENEPGDANLSITRGPEDPGVGEEPEIPPVASACLENGFFADNGVTWCRITEDGDYSLIITYNTHVIGGTDMRFGPTFAQWDDNPEIRSTVESWFSNIPTPELRAITADVNIPIETELPQVAGVNYWPDNNAISTPVVGTTGGRVFLPSMSEINLFAGSGADVEFGGLHPRFEAAIIGGNLVNGDFGVTWLRSPSYILTFLSETWVWTLYSDTGGTYGTQPTWEGFGEDDYGVRPSIWVRTDGVEEWFTGE